MKPYLNQAQDPMLGKLESIQMPVKSPIIREVAANLHQNMSMTSDGFVA